MTVPAPRLAVGLCLPQLGAHVTPEVVREFAVRAERLGFASLWAQEHLFYPEGTAGYQGIPAHPNYRSVWAPTELLAYVAGATSTVRIGTSILVAGYHRPVDLAQRLATLDQLSGGRLIAGFGAGWSSVEHAQMDVDFTTRGARMTEFVRALRACWGPDPVAFDGDFFSIPTSSVNPKPVQPSIPLLSGLRSPAGLRRTAALFDIWNPSVTPELKTQIEGLAALRADGVAPLRVFARAFAQRAVEMPGSGGRGVAGIRDDLQTAIAAGVEHVIIELNYWDAIDSPQAWLEAPALLAPLLDDPTADSSRR